MGDGGGGHWLVRMVGVSASVNLPLHHKVQTFSSGTGLPGWSRKKGRHKTVVVVVVEFYKCIISASNRQTKDFLIQLRFVMYYECVIML